LIFGPSQPLDPSVYLSLAFLFGIAAQFRAMDGYTFLRSVLVAFERRVGILFAVAIATFLFSPLVLNDVVIIVLTPVIVRYARHHSVDPVPLIVAEVTMTNVSSSLTPIGNPQNILLWTASGITFERFVAGTWQLVFLSAGLTVLALLPLARRLGRPRELPAGIVSGYPLLYLALVVIATLAADLTGLPPYAPLGVAFVLGCAFNVSRLGQVRREFDVRALLVLYVFVSAATLASVALSSSLAPSVVPVARGDQPYSGLFFGVVSNVISNVPATQLVLNTVQVGPQVAPKLAVEAGFAGNLGPIASFANLLAIQIARGAGVSVRRLLAMQVVVGVVSFLPALI